MSCSVCCRLVDCGDMWTPPDFWDADDLALGMEDHPCVWTDGSGEDYPTCRFAVASAGVYLPAAGEAPSGVRWRSVGMLGWSAVVLSCQFRVRSRRCSVRNFGV